MASVWFSKKVSGDELISHNYLNTYWQCKSAQDWQRSPYIYD
jgi:hypothetical protein